MSIQYSGSTLVNATWTASTGTRAELADQINTQLVAAGWTSVTNSASNYTLTSATTPQSVKCKVQVLDPGTGNCTQLKFSDGTGANTQTNFLYLLPAVSQIWRIIANKYQFFIKAPGLAATRQFACGGVPWVPSFLSPSQAAWGHGNATTDTDVTASRGGFHAFLAADPNVSSGNQWAVWNSQAMNATNVVSSAGSHRLLTSSPGVNNALNTGYRWADSTLQVYEPLLIWGLTGSGDEGMIRGQLWDAVIISDGFAAESQISFDGHTYQAITHNNAGTTNGYSRGTLFVCVA